MFVGGHQARGGTCCTVVQQRTNVTNVCEMKKRKTFRDSVRHLINVMKMTTANRIEPGTGDLKTEDVEVVLASKLSHFMDKWKDEERVLFETEEEAIIVQKILEEMLGLMEKFNFLKNSLFSLQA